MKFYFFNIFLLFPMGSQSVYAQSTVPKTSSEMQIQQSYSGKTAKLWKEMDETFDVYFEKRKLIFENPEIDYRSEIVAKSRHEVISSILQMQLNVESEISKLHNERSRGINDFNRFKASWDGDIRSLAKEEVDFKNNLRNEYEKVRLKMYSLEKRQ